MGVYLPRRLAWPPSKHQKFLPKHTLSCIATISSPYYCQLRNINFNKAIYC